MVRGYVRGWLIRTHGTEVWAETACRSKANEEYLERVGKVSRIHQKKPKGWPMPHPWSVATAQGRTSGRKWSMCLLKQGAHEPVHPNHRNQACRGHDHSRQYPLSRAQAWLAT